MDYFRMLGLEKEPFSNSPDPEFFFESPSHQECLFKTELAVRLKRGLSVVVGDVGSGKTTLCRQLIRSLSGDRKVETHLILDPDFGSPARLLKAFAGMLGLPLEPADDEWAIKERIKHRLFQRGVEEGKTVVLLIDEGQKLRGFGLETLRELLNFETNQAKLLQIVIFAQEEFEEALLAHHNFADRISLYHPLEPLGFSDTRAMIRHRLQVSSGAGKAPRPFTLPALRAIYRASGGYPRRIVNLCHQSLLEMIVRRRNRVNWLLVHSCLQRPGPARAGRRHALALGALAGLVALALLLGLLSSRFYLRGLWEGAPDGPSLSASEPEAPLERGERRPVVPEGELWTQGPPAAN